MKACRFRLSATFAFAALVSPLSAGETPGLIVTISADTVDDMDNQTSLREAVTYAGRRRWRDKRGVADGCPA